MIPINDGGFPYISGGFSLRDAKYNAEGDKKFSLRTGLTKLPEGLGFATKITSLFGIDIF
jgi:hypothetical protein